MIQRRRSGLVTIFAISERNAGKFTAKIRATRLADFKLCVQQAFLDLGFLITLFLVRPTLNARFNLLIILINVCFAKKPVSRVSAFLDGQGSGQIYHRTMSRVENWTRKEREKQTCHRRHGQSDFSCFCLWWFSSPFRDEFTIVVRPPGTCRNSREKLSNKSHVIDLLEKFVCLAFVSLLRMLLNGKSLKGGVRWMWLLRVKDLNRVLVKKNIPRRNPNLTFWISENSLGPMFTLPIHLKLEHKSFSLLPQITLDPITIWRHSSQTLLLQRSFRSLLINSQQQTFSFLQRECVNGPYVQLKHNSRPYHLANQ